MNECLTKEGEFRQLEERKNRKVPSEREASFYCFILTTEKELSYLIVILWYVKTLNLGVQGNSSWVRSLDG